MSSSNTTEWNVADFLRSIGVDEEDVGPAAGILTNVGFTKKKYMESAQDSILKEAGISMPIRSLILQHKQKRPADNVPGVGEPEYKKFRALAGDEAARAASGQVTNFFTDSTTLLNPARTDTIRYFFRDGVSELLNEIINSQNGKRYFNIALIGNPGSGKSNLAYHAAECLAFHKSTPVLWVGRRFRSNTWTVKFFSPLQGDSEACLEVLKAEISDLSVILSSTKAHQAQVLVLDAPTRSDDESAYDGARAFEWAGNENRKNNRRVIHVSSLGAFAHKQTVRDEVNLREVPMRIWTRDDFVLSLNDAGLKEKVCNTLDIQDVGGMTNEELVDMKFFYSGINACWFFNFTIAQITKDCDEIMGRLTSGSIDDGTKALRAINSIQATVFDGERSFKVFTSSYLAQLAGEDKTFQNQFLDRFPLVKKYLGNGAPGEIFECDFAIHLQQSHDIARAQVAVMGNRAQQVTVNLGVDEGGNRLEWATGMLRTLPTAKNDVIVPQSTGLKASALKKRDPQWFIPEDNSQAFLDFMVLVPLETGTSWQLKIIQNTVGKTHSADTSKLVRIVRGVLDDGFALDKEIVLAYVIEDRGKSGNIANTLNGTTLSVQTGGDSPTVQVFTLNVLHPVYKRRAKVPE